MSLAATHAMPPRSRRIEQVSSASRPVGARTSRRSSSGLTFSFNIFTTLQQGSGLAGIRRDAGEHPLELAQRLADVDSAGAEPEFANGALVSAGAFLDDRDRLPDLPVCFKVAHEQRRV